jgi:Protein of unknown function (DUF2721)
MEAHIPEISRVIQLAVAPVFLLAGIGTIMGSLMNRLSRIVDRARTLESEAGRSGGEPSPEVRYEAQTLRQRARAVQTAIALLVTCALLVTLLISIAFVGAFIAVDVTRVIAVMFIVAMCAFSAGLLSFLHEIRIAMSTFRIEIERAERPDRG